MARARRNPRGYPLAAEHLRDARVVRVGQRGVHTHLYSPEMQDVLCQSGKNAGRYAEGANREAVLKNRQAGGEREFYPALSREDQQGKNRWAQDIEPAMITCYRCVKLAQLNIANGRDPWEPPSRD